MMEAGHFEPVIQFGPLSFQVTKVQAYLMMIIDDSERYGASGRCSAFALIMISNRKRLLAVKADAIVKTWFIEQAKRTVG